VAIPEPDAALLQALLSGHALLPALEACDLDFSSWLPEAIQNGWVLGADVRR